MTKLKVVGVICPQCGDKMTYVSKLAVQDTWIGYTRQAWCNCHDGKFESRCYLLLYDEHKLFVTIIPGTDLFLRSAGNRIHIHDTDEIPF